MFLDSKYRVSIFAIFSIYAVLIIAYWYYMTQVIRSLSSVESIHEEWKQECEKRKSTATFVPLEEDLKLNDVIVLAPSQAYDVVFHLILEEPEMKYMTARSNAEESVRFKAWEAREAFAVYMAPFLKAI